MGGEAPPITAIQNTQAHSEFLTTSIPKQKPRLHKNYLDPLVNEPPCLDFRKEKQAEEEKRRKEKDEMSPRRNVKDSDSDDTICGKK